jgi:protein SCO1/2
MNRRTLPAPLLATALRGLAAGVCGALLLLGSASPAHAQRSGKQIEQLEGTELNQKLGASIPQGLTFRNAQGERVKLARYFDGETPVILHMAYFSCPMLCPLMLQGLTDAMKDLSWTPGGGQFKVLTVSFNHREGPKLARKKKNTYVQKLGKKGAGAGWHFLTGDRETIRKLTQAVGFNFRWVEKEQEFAHPATAIFLSGKGTAARYLLGIGPPDLTGGKMRTALVEASNGNVGNVLDQAVLYCFQYDPNSNSYTASAFNLMRLGSALTVILLGGVLVFYWRREQKKNRDEDLDTAASSFGSDSHWNSSLQEEARRKET